MIIHTFTLFSFAFCYNPNKALPLHSEKIKGKKYYGFQFHRDYLVSSSSRRCNCACTEDQGGILIVIHRYCARRYIIQHVDGHRF